MADCVNIVIVTNRVKTKDGKFQALRYFDAEYSIDGPWLVVNHVDQASKHRVLTKILGDSVVSVTEEA